MAWRIDLTTNRESISVRPVVVILEHHAIDMGLLIFGQAVDKGVLCRRPAPDVADQKVAVVLGLVESLLGLFWCNLDLQCGGIKSVAF